MSLTNLGLVEHCKKALNEHWGYVRGTYGLKLTESILDAKLKQCGDDVRKYLDFIKEHYMGKRTADCVNLIKSYLWWDPEKDNPVYSSKYDVNADGMFAAAKEKGTIDTIPEIIGLGVWHKGHIGTYIGNGQVIESKGTKYGVVQTPVKGTGANTWTHWLKFPWIEYIVPVKEPVDELSSALKTICTECNLDYTYWYAKAKEVKYLDLAFIKIGKVLGGK